jgi:general stress protein YciG
MQKRQKGDTTRRGFASMDAEKQREIARKGGRSVPDEKRSFSRDSGLAAEAGRKGGRAVSAEKRSFSQDRELAAEAGRKGGKHSHIGAAAQAKAAQAKREGGQTPDESATSQPEKKAAGN